MGSPSATPSKRDAAVLLIDAVVNLLLGLPLVFFPHQTAALLGLPDPGSLLYASLLGAVLVGIGLALIIECRGTRLPSSGLGLGGALSINLCGVAMLSALVADLFVLPPLLQLVRKPPRPSVETYD